MTSCSYSLPLSRVCSEWLRSKQTYVLNNCPYQKFSSLVQISSFIHRVHLSKGCAVTLNSRSDVNVKADFFEIHFWSLFSLPLSNLAHILPKLCLKFLLAVTLKQVSMSKVKVIAYLCEIYLSRPLFLSLWSNTIKVVS